MNRLKSSGSGKMACRGCFVASCAVARICMTRAPLELLPQQTPGWCAQLQRRQQLKVPTSFQRPVVSLGELYT